jgi:Zn2+/Cd2+-exporting ATPase
VGRGAILLFLFSLSGALEGYALDKSRHAIHSLLELRPSQGLRKNPDGSEELIPIEELQIGDIVIVKPVRTHSDRWKVKKG